MSAPEVRSIRRRTAFALAALGGASVVWFVVSAFTLHTYVRIGEPLSTSDLDRLIDVDDALVAAQLLLLVVVAATLGALFHGARTALAAVGRPIGESAGLAAACCFIPLANFVLPPRVARGLLQASDVGRDEVKRLVTSWWAVFMVGLVGNYVAKQMVDLGSVGSVDDARSVLLLSGAGLALVSVAGVLGCRVVVRLGAAVDETTQRRAATVAPLPPPSGYWAPPAAPVPGAS